MKENVLRGNTTWRHLCTFHHSTASTKTRILSGPLRPQFPFLSLSHSLSYRLYQTIKSITMTILSEAMVYSKTRTQNLNNVKQLNAWGSDLTDVSIVRSMPFVQVLSLSVNKISSLEDFSACQNLQELYLRENNVKDLDQIYHLQELPFLRKLWLAGNPCAEREDYRRTVLRVLPHLETLDNVNVTQEEVDQARAGMTQVAFDRRRESPIPVHRETDVQRHRRPSSSNEAEEEYEEEEPTVTSQVRSGQGSGQVSGASSESSSKNCPPVSQAVLRNHRLSYQEGVQGDSWATPSAPNTARPISAHVSNSSGMVRSQSVADYTLFNGHPASNGPTPKSVPSDKNRRHLLPKGGKNRVSFDTLIH